jgi:hypothetical protein
MKNKRTAQSAFFNLRRLLTTVVCGASILSGTLFAFFRSDTSSASYAAFAGLHSAERVAYQRAIETFTWRHRIWPHGRGERPDPKPSLDAVMPQAEMGKKVKTICATQALQDYWHSQAITPDQLQAEMERIASHTKQPGCELFTRAGQRSFYYRECLPRPALADRIEKLAPTSAFIVT